MEQVQVTLTVYFEEPFWVGVCECVSERKMQAKKIVFGAEPQMQELLQMVQQQWYTYMQFGAGISMAQKKMVHKNPKRLQRQIKKQTTEHGVGTKAQQALQAEREANKIIRKQKSKAEKQAEQKQKFLQKQQKKKEKHRGHEERELKNDDTDWLGL